MDLLFPFLSALSRDETALSFEWMLKFIKGAVGRHEASSPVYPSILLDFGPQWLVRHVMKCNLAYRFV